MANQRIERLDQLPAKILTEKIITRLPLPNQLQLRGVNRKFRRTIMPTILHQRTSLKLFASRSDVRLYVRELFLRHLENEPAFELKKGGQADDLVVKVEYWGEGFFRMLQEAMPNIRELVVYLGPDAEDKGHKLSLLLPKYPNLTSFSFLGHLDFVPSDLLKPFINSIQSRAHLTRFDLCTTDPLITRPKVTFKPVVDCEFNPIISDSTSSSSSEEEEEFEPHRKSIPKKNPSMCFRPFIMETDFLSQLEQFSLYPAHKYYFPEITAMMFRLKSLRLESFDFNPVGMDQMQTALLLNPELRTVTELSIIATRDDEADERKVYDFVEFLCKNFTKVKILEIGFPKPTRLTSSFISYINLLTHLTQLRLNSLAFYYTWMEFTCFEEPMFNVERVYVDIDTSKHKDAYFNVQNFAQHLSASFPNLKHLTLVSGKPLEERFKAHILTDKCVSRNILTQFEHLLDFEELNGEEDLNRFMGRHYDGPECINIIE